MKTTIVKIAVNTACCGMLLGCGSHSNTNATGGLPVATSPQPIIPSDTGPSRFDSPSCMSTPNIPVQSADAPSDDIRGLRTGVSLDDAISYIECSDRKVAFASTAETNTIGGQYFGREVRTFVEIATGKPIKVMAYTPGNLLAEQLFSPLAESYKLLAFGDPKHETVYGITREQVFSEENGPTVAATTDALTTKYGVPQFIDNSANGKTYYWVYDPQEHPMAKSDIAARQCANGAGDGGQGNWTNGCGLTIHAAYRTKVGNELLVARLTVSVIEQAKLVDVAQQLQASWKAQDETRKRSEADKAKGSAPQL